MAPSKLHTTQLAMKNFWPSSLYYNKIKCFAIFNCPKKKCLFCQYVCLLTVINRH